MSLKHSAAALLAILAFASVFGLISLVSVAEAQMFGQGGGGMMGGDWGWGMGYGMGGVGGIGVLVLGLVVVGIALMAFRRRSP